MNSFKMKLMLIVIIVIFTAQAVGKKQKNQCLVKFIQTFLLDDRKTIVFLRHKNILTAEGLLQANIPKIIVTFPMNAFTETFLKAPSNYLIMSTNVKKLKDTLKILENWKWNTRGKFLFLVENNATESFVSGMLRTSKNTVDKFLLKFPAFLEMLLKHNIYNVVVAKPNSSQFFTWYPYNQENQCGSYCNLIKINFCQNRTFSLNPYKDKIPNNMHNCTIRVLWSYTGMIVRLPTEQHTGMFTFLYAAQKKMNFSLWLYRSDSYYK